MKIFKFGGASIKDADSIRNVAHILQKYAPQRPLVVISAAGKTTNMLEAVVQAYFRQDDSLEGHLQRVKDYHQQLMDGLFGTPPLPLSQEINDLWVDIEWLFDAPPQDPYDYVYDQVVSTGELLSTKIVAAYLQQIGMPAYWLDVRDCLLTDNIHRDAGILWDSTLQRIARIVPPLQAQHLIVTQGFIGCTTENFTTTLGREGSDFTTAIFAYCLDAQSMTIWKDVPGVLTADPRLFPDATLLQQLSYEEAIEMTYYGAQVIHPKTIRPLQNKQIPLYVKSFLHPDNDGTVIHAQPPAGYPPIFVVKTNQAILKLSSRDFHFVDERRFARLFDLLASHRIKVNMTQNTALSFSVCVDDIPDKIERFMAAAHADYEIEKIAGLQLLTLRHATPQLLQQHSQHRTILLEAHIRNNTQFVFAAD